MAGILDADMTTLAGKLRDGLAWWLDELREMMPPWLGRLGGRTALVTARWSDGTFVLSRNGTVVASPPEGRTLPVAVVLPAEMVLVRSLMLPALGRRDIARLVALDAERLLPFAPGTAVTDIIVGAEASEGQIAVTLGAVARDAATAVLAEARAAGLTPQRLGLAGRFDFLPELEGGRGSGARFWWRIVAVLAAVLVTAVILRDVQRTRELETLVTAHADGATNARALRLRVVAEHRRRAAWLATRERRDPVMLLAAATRALPDAVWVQRLDYDGTKLRLAGYKAGTADPVGALRKVALFSAVRPSNSDIAPPQPLGQPFDITAELVATR